MSWLWLADLSGRAVPALRCAALLDGLSGAGLAGPTTPGIMTSRRYVPGSGWSRREGVREWVASQSPTEGEIQRSKRTASSCRSRTGR